MPGKKYVVTLSVEERASLSRLVSAGKLSARILARARILLKVDASPIGPCWRDARVAEAVEVSVRTVERVRQHLIEQGLNATLARKPQDLSSRRSKLDGQRLKRAGPPESPQLREEPKHLDAPAPGRDLLRDWDRRRHS